MSQQPAPPPPFVWNALLLWQLVDGDRQCQRPPRRKPRPKETP